MKNLLLVDGNNLLYRAAFGFPTEIKDRNGKNITGVFGFFALLRIALKEIPGVMELVVVFDGQNSLEERKKLDVNYKANRPVLVLNPYIYLEEIIKGLEGLGINWISLDNYEADDVIASLNNQLPHLQSLILSTDKDFYQLVSTETSILNTGMMVGRRLIDESSIYSKFKVNPSQWCDFRSLMGDPADNIAGVMGIGPLNASKLLNSFLCLENILSSESLDKYVQMVRENRDQVLQWKQMITLNKEIVLPHIIPGSLEDLPIPSEVMKKLGIW